MSHQKPQNDETNAMIYLFKINLCVYSGVSNQVGDPLFTFFLTKIESLSHFLDVDLLMNTAVGFRNELTSILHEIILNRTQEKVIGNHFFTFLELLLSTIKVKSDKQSFNEFGDRIPVFIRLLLNDLDQFLHLVLSTFAGHNSSGEVTEHPRARGLDGVNVLRSKEHINDAVTTTRMVEDNEK